MTESEKGIEQPLKSRGAGIIFRIKSSGELMFFLRDDKDSIPFPNQIDIIGGRMEDKDGGDPEVTARREVSEELRDITTHEPFVPPEMSHFKTFVDDRPGEHNIYVCELDFAPFIETVKGQELVFLSPEKARETDFAYGYSQVVNEYLDSLEVSEPTAMSPEAQRAFEADLTQAFISRVGHLHRSGESFPIEELIAWKTLSDLVEPEHAEFGILARKITELIAEQEV